MLRAVVKLRHAASHYPPVLWPQLSPHKTPICLRVRHAKTALALLFFIPPSHFHFAIPSPSFCLRVHATSCKYRDLQSKLSNNVPRRLTSCDKTNHTLHILLCGGMDPLLCRDVHGERTHQRRTRGCTSARILDPWSRHTMNAIPHLFTMKWPLWSP